MGGSEPLRHSKTPQNPPDPHKQSMTQGGPFQTHKRYNSLRPSQTPLNPPRVSGTLPEHNKPSILQRYSRLYSPVRPFLTLQEPFNFPDPPRPLLTLFDYLRPSKILQHAPRPFQALLFDKDPPRPIYVMTSYVMIFYVMSSYVKMSYIITSNVMTSTDNRGSDLEKVVKCPQAEYSELYNVLKIT